MSGLNYKCIVYKLKRDQKIQNQIENLHFILDSGFHNIEVKISIYIYIYI